MQDLNTVIVVGRLTKDINVEYTNSGMAIGKGSIAVKRSTKKNGEWTEDVSFFDFSLFGKMAESLKPYLTKGKQVVLGGYLKQDRWTSQEGQSRSKVYIGVNDIQLCGGGQNNGRQDQQPDDNSYGFDNNDQGYGYSN